MTTEAQQETSQATQAPLAAELNKAAALLKKGHKTRKLLAPEKRKAAKAKAKTKAQARKAKRAKPTSGQSGPSIDGLSWDDLNKKEKRVVGCFELKGEREVHTIEGLAKEAFGSQTLKRANSWVRNSLRRLIRSGWLEKVTPGEYRLSTDGRRWLARADS